MPMAEISARKEVYTGGTLFVTACCFPIESRPPRCSRSSECLSLWCSR
jgi:hypothetical protein